MRIIFFVLFRRASIKHEVIVGEFQRVPRTHETVRKREARTRFFVPKNYPVHVGYTNRLVENRKPIEMAVFFVSKLFGAFFTPIRRPGVR